MPSPRTSPIQSPVVIGPDSLAASRTACVTSPVATDAAASVISSRLSSASASGSYTTSAASAAGIEVVGTTLTDLRGRARRPARRRG